MCPVSAAAAPLAKPNKAKTKGKSVPPAAKVSKIPGNKATAAMRSIQPASQWHRPKPMYDSTINITKIIALNVFCTGQRKGFPLGQNINFTKVITLPDKPIAPKTNPSNMGIATAIFS